MIAADTSVLVDYLSGVESAHTRRVDEALSLHQLFISPVVVTELLSNPRPPDILPDILEKLYQLSLEDGAYWERAGKNRAKLKAKGLKARTADALIAQSCIDHDVPLLTRDPDFRHFAQYCGLKLVVD